MNSVDDINLGMMRFAEAVAHYCVHDELFAHEIAALACVAAQFRGAPILDLGVGGGRSVKALRAISVDYLGIDYSPEMLAACRRRYPNVRFEYADARQLTKIASDSIGLAVFTCNGISMVTHEDRLAILREVHRVLRPGGVFVFTTYNRNSAEAEAGFRYPEFDFSFNPLRFAVRSARFVRDSLVSLRNRRRYVKFEMRTDGYAIINDRCHNHGVMLYYIALAQQRQQLVDQGFEPNAQAFDSGGEPMREDTRLDSMAFVARKA